MARYYADENREKIKSTLILEEAITDTALRQFLKENRVTVEYPSMGAKKDLLKFTEYNLLSFAKNHALASLSALTASRATMENILDRL